MHRLLSHPLLVVLLSLSCVATVAVAEERPNVLWLVAEDISPTLGCYGDPLARTPNIDSLAARGVRYTNAVSNAPVCAVARATLIYGMYATTTGTHNMRCATVVPDRFEHFPRYLADAGYFTLNQDKTDFNDARPDKEAFIANGWKRGYHECKPEQPFFAMINCFLTHESRVQRGNHQGHINRGDIVDADLVTTAEVSMPSYQPDLPELREDWARYYTTVHAMDRWIGQQLQQLDESGQADNTIVFFFADHGGNLARSKRFLFESGVRVPLIVAFPDKWQHLAPQARGGVVNDPVGFIDFAPTVLDLCGVEIPDHMQGRSFLEDSDDAARDFSLLFRNRMDGRIDLSRGVRGREHHYVLNLMPHRPYGKHLDYPFRMQLGWPAWHRAFEAGGLPEVHARFWQAKPFEEFYEIEADPAQTCNLAGVSAGVTHDALVTARGICRRRLIETRDAGLIPEAMLKPLAGDATFHDYCNSDAYPIERVVDIAIAAASGSEEHDHTLLKTLTDEHPVLRYWAAVGFAIRAAAGSPTDRSTSSVLTNMMHTDAQPACRIAAAEALASGNTDNCCDALGVLREHVLADEPLVALLAMNTLEAVGGQATMPRAEVRRLADNDYPHAYIRRIAQWWLRTRPQHEVIEQAAPQSTAMPAGVNYRQPDRKTLYKSTPQADLHLHVFNPPTWQASDRRPAAVFYHGGGWNNGKPSAHYWHCSYLASRGMVAFSVEYRLRDAHATKPIDCVEDARDALAFIRENAATLGVDPDRIVVGGGSAGGHLAACTALGGAKAPLDIDPPSALLLFNPVLKTTGSRFSVERLGIEPASLSPIDNLRRQLPPTIIFTGSADKITPVAIAEAFTEAAASCGNDCRLVIYPDAPHSFFHRNREDGRNFVDTVRRADIFLESLGLLEGPPTIGVENAR